MSEALNINDVLSPPRARTYFGDNLESRQTAFDLLCKGLGSTAVSKATGAPLTSVVAMKRAIEKFTAPKEITGALPESLMMWVSV